MDKTVFTPEAAEKLAVSFLNSGTGTTGNLVSRTGWGSIADGLRLLDPATRFAGRAVTVKISCDPDGGYSEEDFNLGPAVDTIAPGDVFVLDNGGKPFAVMGGIAALAAKLRGAAGVVAEGALRDVDEIIACGLPAYTRHVVLPSGVRRVRFEAVNVEVKVSGITVRPGDFLVGDVGGLVVIPAEHAEELAVMVRKVGERDAMAEAALRAGKSFTEVIKMIRAPIKISATKD